MGSGVHPSLHSNCHHQITYANFNLKIHYPPPYEQEIWHYQNANTDQIRKTIEQFSWDWSFKNLDVNFIVNPTWINNKVKELINEKNDTFQYYLNKDKDNNDSNKDSNKDPKLFNQVEYL